MNVTVHSNGRQPPTVASDEIDLGSSDFVAASALTAMGPSCLRRTSPIRFVSEPVRRERTAAKVTGHSPDMSRCAARADTPRTPARPRTQMVDAQPQIASCFDSMLTSDDPRHQRLRSLVSRAFTPAVLATVLELISLRARSRVSAMLRGHPNRVSDFVNEVAGPLPLQVCAT
jgi:methyl-branched lipid omega-hydroxylase